MSVEVEDVDAVYHDMVTAGADIVYALRDEPWGVRRFFVRDPSGTIVNVVDHS
ncbi:VOC family protein [Nocardia sp. KC 131]|uniref:VOC family protein n=1 Tax=Nocardia arseniciresistens TaxID=3392119 RepID=UPI00398E4F89